MSGGSMDYLYSRVQDATFRESTPLRRAFRKHLYLVASAMRAIEWNDSCDGDDGEDAAIRAALAPNAELAQLIDEARAAQAALTAALEGAK